MSCGASAALQASVFTRLSEDPAVSALIGGAIYDATPEGTLPDTYVTLGPEEVRDRSDITGHGADHDFTVSVVTTLGGFAQAKLIAGAIADALIDAPLTLERGRLAGLWFVGARARRVRQADIRRIDVRFRARIDID